MSYQKYPSTSTRNENIPNGWSYHDKTLDGDKGYSHAIYGAVVLRHNGQWEALGFNQQCFAVVSGPEDGMRWLKNAHDQSRGKKKTHRTAPVPALLKSTRVK